LLLADPVWAPHRLIWHHTGEIGADGHGTVCHRGIFASAYSKTEKTNGHRISTKGRIAALSPLVAVNGFVSDLNPHQIHIPWACVSKSPEQHLGRFSLFSFPAAKAHNAFYWGGQSSKIASFPWRIGARM